MPMSHKKDAMLILVKQALHRGQKAHQFISLGDPNNRNNRPDNATVMDPFSSVLNKTIRKWRLYYLIDVYTMCAHDPTPTFSCTAFVS